MSTLVPRGITSVPPALLGLRLNNARTAGPDVAHDALGYRLSEVLCKRSDRWVEVRPKRFGEACRTRPASGACAQALPSAPFSRERAAVRAGRLASLASEITSVEGSRSFRLRSLGAATFAGSTHGR